jgi:hypothetical protein
LSIVVGVASFPLNAMTAVACELDRFTPCDAMMLAVPHPDAVTLVEELTDAIPDDAILTLYEESICVLELLLTV